MITPLLIRSFGRSGSTLMMQILASSKDIIFERKYPFEVRYLTYLTRVAQVITSDHSEDPLPFKWEQRALYNDKPRYIAHLPVEDRLVDAESFFQESLFALWKAFSNTVLESQPNVKFYAEKVLIDIPKYINQIIFCKNLFLLRDPRDEMVSVMKFNQKRGTLAFGWQDTDNDISFAKRHCDERRVFMRDFLRIKKGENKRIAVLYEQLIQKPDLVIAEVANWLELNLDLSCVEENKQKIFQNHATSLSAQESIGKWKTELSAEVLDIFKFKLGSELQALGYEV